MKPSGFCVPLAVFTIFCGTISAEPAPGTPAVWSISVVTKDRNDHFDAVQGGGPIAGTTPWACVYRPLGATRAAGTGRVWEDLHVSCQLGEAEVQLDLTCGYRSAPKAAKSRQRMWKLGERHSISLHKKGDLPTDGTTLTVGCDVDSRYLLDL